MIDFLSLAILGSKDFENSDFKYGDSFQRNVINQKQAFIRPLDLKQVEIFLNNLIGTHQDCLATGSVIAAYTLYLSG